MGRPRKTETENVITRKSAIPTDFAALARLIVKDLIKNNRDIQFFKKYKKQDVITYLENPARYEKQLRDISIFLYNISPQYKRLINHFATMLLLTYTVEPMNLDVQKTNIKMFKIAYKNVLDSIDNMNLKHELGRALKIAYREDCFFGYEYSTKDSYFIQKLNPDYCTISSIEDGVYNFAFDFTYFDRYKEKLDTYADEFRAKYSAYQNDSNLRWQELDSNFTICIKINEDLEYIIPPFAGVFESLFDIEDYKSLKKAKEELGNYKVLIEELPIRKDSENNNDFSIELELAKDFHNKASQALPDQVGLILSPMKITSESFDKDKVDNDNVANAERDYWNAAGVSQLLFNSDKGGSIGLNRSIESDETIVFSVLRQVERWINRKVKNFNGAYKFKVNMLDITVFNQDEYFNRVLKGAQYGLPVKSIACAALGLSPSSMINMTYLENEVLGLHESFIPLQSSHTQTSTDPGRPQSEGVISESGEKTRDTNGNDNRAK